MAIQYLYAHQLYIKIMFIVLFKKCSLASKFNDRGLL